MKRIYFLLFAIVGLLTSCESVDPGHVGVEVSFGGKTNLQEVYPEGLHSGFHWMTSDLILYDVREKTLVQKFEFNDKDNMITPVEISLDYRVIPDKANFVHSKISDFEKKLNKTLKSAAKEVIPKYSAVELNISKRTEAEDSLAIILREELPAFYDEFIRIQMTDVDLPRAVSALAEETAVQLGKNELASKKEAEQQSLAKALVAKAKGEFEAAEYDAQTKDVLSQPKMLKLYELDIEMEWAKRGVSRYGSNNVFGSETGIIKGLK